jgi:hypothetical protein
MSVNLISMTRDCRLCKKTGVSPRRSHLLPAALYKLLRTDGRSDPNPVVWTKQSATTTSLQVPDYLLTSARMCAGLVGCEIVVALWYRANLGLCRR